MSFNSIAIKFLHFCEPVHQIQEIQLENYKPNASTPLLDAAGLGFLFMEDKLNEYFEETPYSVLVSILTDGEENSSFKMKLEQVKSIISRLSELGWTFTYIGTDQDVVKMLLILISRTTCTLKERRLQSKACLRERCLHARDTVKKYLARKIEEVISTTKIANILSPA